MIKATIRSVLALSLLAASGCGKQPAQEAAPPATTAAPPTAMPHPAPTAAGAAVDLSGIQKAEGGKTVAEVYADKDQLAGKPVTFRGKVVKTNAMIMDRNWLHVRDGSGAEGSNDLTVTTTGTLPEIGETVLVTGTVAINKDYGMGYQYPVVIEDAAVTVE